MVSVLSVPVDSGQYTVVQNMDGSTYALRYGERWRDLTGDNLVLCLALELEAARAACRQAAEVMVAQEKRESEEFHLSAEAFRPMWDAAKEACVKAAGNG